MPMPVSVKVSRFLLRFRLGSVLGGVTPLVDTAAWYALQGL